VLTKADLCEDADARRAEVEAVAPGVPVHAISALRGEGLAPLAPYLEPGRTSALVGSSGVGKSTLVNALAGGDVQTVRAIREHDDTGVHTTTARRLIPLAGRGCLVDTPGMRELGLCDSEEGLDATFSDVSSLAPQCRFRDCTHENEPGCAVLAAVQSGALAEERLESFRHLRRELRFVAAKERKRERAMRHGQPDARREAEEARPWDE
jgi:ribosome biogenesis GTPase